MRMQNQTKIQCLLASLAVILVGSACGPQPYVPGTMRSHQTAAGNTTIPAKVDIVFGVSQNGTMLNIFPGLQNEIPAFLQNLESSGWDYRFVGIPLSEGQINTPALFPITQKVSVSRYDTNTVLANWLAPFPGALYTDPTLKINSSLVAPTFTYPSASSGSAINGKEGGLRNQLEFLQRNDVSTGFIRSDATLAIVTLSNGDDRSYYTWAYNPTTHRVDGTPAASSVYTNAINQLKGMKSNSANVKYYSLVAPLNFNNCRGLGAWSGINYANYANQMNGRNIDICSIPINSALATIAQDIKNTGLNYERNFMVLDSEPNPGSISVVKYPGGVASAAVKIAQDATNGWTYAGKLTNQYTIDLPIPMDQRTGFMIELHGSAKLVGQDTADVFYVNIGSSNAH